MTTKRSTGLDITMTETYMGRDYMYITPTMTATQDGNKSAPALW